MKAQWVGLIVIFLVASWRMAWPAFAAAADAGIPVLALDKPEALGKLSPKNAQIEWLRPGAMRVAFALADWPNVFFAAGKAYERQDWREFGALALEMANPGDETVDVYVRVDDDAKADGLNHCRTGRAKIGPKERVTLVLEFESSTPGMRGAPPLPVLANARRMEYHGKPLDMSHIVAFQVFLPKPKAPRTLELANPRWLPKPDLNGLVDKFGQFSRADWPGKLHDEAEFAQRRDAEAQWLKANPPPADRDEYGGWQTGPKLNPTGFFRTALVLDGREVVNPKSDPPYGGQNPKSRWWLVTPTGHLFWSIGITGVRPRAEGPIDGRQHLFAWLPDPKAKQADFYNVNLRRKYGDDWQTPWAQMSCDRLRSWGFNTIANWSDPLVFRARRVPYTVPIHYGGLPYLSAEEYKHVPGAHRRLPDFFDEKFPPVLDAAVAKATAEWKDDPWCLGYFVDNELAWDSWAQLGTGGDYLTPREAIGAKPDLAARRAFVAQLKTKYGTLEALNAAWGVKAASWDDPIRLTKEQLNAASRADCSAFLTALAERYFTVVSAAMKKHAPNQLYLGPRFAIRPKEVIAVAAKYCDVVSFNIYRRTVDANDWAFTSALGKPAVIGEFHFGATDRGMFHTGLGPCKSQEERAAAYQGYVRSVLALPAFVGCHWFQYPDQALTGRFDGENYNIGFVTVTDTPYPELRAAARELNTQIYTLRQ